MAEYIEREALLLKLHNELSAYGSPSPKITPVSFGSMLGMQDAVHIVAGFPAADVVEVVRCRDCKHRGQKRCPIAAVLLEYGCEGEWERSEDFCSFGERIEKLCISGS